MLPTSKEQDNVTRSGQDVECVFRKVAHGAVDHAVEQSPSPEEGDDWEVEYTIRLDEAEPGGVSRGLRGLQKSRWC